MNSRLVFDPRTPMLRFTMREAIENRHARFSLYFHRFHKLPLYSTGVTTQLLLDWLSASAVNTAISVCACLQGHSHDCRVFSVKRPCGYATKISIRPLSSSDVYIFLDGIAKVRLRPDETAHFEVCTDSPLWTGLSS